jgi:hypothetical protein
MRFFVQELHRHDPSGRLAIRQKMGRQQRGSGSESEEEELAGAAEHEDADLRLPAVHRSLLQLERRQHAALFSARTAHGGGEDKHRALQRQLANLDAFFERVAGRAMQIIRNAPVEAAARPAVLVAILQMIERQERADARFRAEQNQEVAPAQRAGGRAGGDAGVPGAKVRGWFALALETLEEYCATRFDMLVASQLPDGGRGACALNVEQLVAEHQKIIDEIVSVKDLVEACFPPHYHVTDVFVRAYHFHLCTLVRRIMDQHAAALATRDIIRVVQWLRDYHGQLEGLGVVAEPVLTKDLDQLLQGYNFQAESAMRNWASRILETDFSLPPESAGDGRLYTMAPVDLFKMMDQQFEVAHALEDERPTYTLAMTVTNVLDDYRASLLDVIARLGVAKLQLDHICAQVNNSVRCVECCLELHAALAARLPARLVDNVELDRAADAFAHVGRAGTEVLATIIANDVAPLLRRLFLPRWASGAELVAESVVATVEDYARELRIFLLESFFRKVLIEVLQNIVVSTVARLLDPKELDATGIPSVAELSAGIFADVDTYAMAFPAMGLPERMLAPRLEPLRALGTLFGIFSGNGVLHDAGGRVQSGSVRPGPEVERELRQRIPAWFVVTSAAHPGLSIDALARFLRLSGLDAPARHQILVVSEETHRSAAHVAPSGSARQPFEPFAAAYRELDAQPLPLEKLLDRGPGFDAGKKLIQAVKEGLRTAKHATSVPVQRPGEARRRRQATWAQVPLPLSQGLVRQTHVLILWCLQAREAAGLAGEEEEGHYSLRGANALDISHRLVPEPPAASLVTVGLN